MKTKSGLLLSISAAVACCYLLIQPLAASATGVENSSRGEATATIATANPAALDYLPDLVINQTEVVPNDDNKLRVHVVNIGNADAGPCNLKLF